VVDGALLGPVVVAVAGAVGDSAVELDEAMDGLGPPGVGATYVAPADAKLPPPLRP
jgi:hypothetical protein